MCESAIKQPYLRHSYRLFLKLLDRGMVSDHVRSHEITHKPVYAAGFVIVRIYFVGSISKPSVAHTMVRQTVGWLGLLINELVIVWEEASVA